MTPKFPLPERITFTGVDEWVDLDGLAKLSRLYPVEWGVLIGGRLGKARYPSLDRIASIARAAQEQPTMNLALHVCGDLAQRAMSEGDLPEEDIDLSAFGRVQINARTYDVPALGRLAAKYNVDVIMQVRGDIFPTDLPPRVFALHDESGGKGLAPESRPAATYSQFVGYAGGIRPNNVLDVIADITDTNKYLSPYPPNYWIDMETGVRDNADHLDLGACASICEKVFRDVGSFSTQKYLRDPDYEKRFNSVRRMLAGWQIEVRSGRESPSYNALAIAIVDKLIEDSHVIPSGSVRMPTSLDEAKMMNLVATHWLRSSGQGPETEK